MIAGARGARPANVVIATVHVYERLTTSHDDLSSALDCRHSQASSTSARREDSPRAHGLGAAEGVEHVGEDGLAGGEGGLAVTYGELADVFLVFARAPEGPTAFLVERDRPGLRTEPIFGMFGIRGSMTAKVWLDGCRVPRTNLVARPGLGVSHVAGAALDLGRYTVAWGCVGILDACLAATLDYTGARRQFGQPLKEHQLVRRLVSDMVTDAHAARLLCTEAGRLKDAGDPGALAATSIAKYFASTAAARAAGDAMQLHGANGCSAGYPLQRYLGDAKIAEVIEGSTQIQQIVIAEYGYQNRAGERGASAPASGEMGT